MKSPLVFFWLGCLSSAGAVAGGPVSSARYIDAQGVEVIHNRNAETATGQPVAGPEGVVTNLGAQDQARRRQTPDIGVQNDPKLRVSAAEQEQRDRGRVDILQQELEAEVRSLEAVTRRAQRAAADKLSAAQVQRVTEELNEHQQNILALHAELRRARSAR